MHPWPSSTAKADAAAIGVMIGGVKSSLLSYFLSLNYPERANFRTKVAEVFLAHRNA